MTSSTDSPLIVVFAALLRSICAALSVYVVAKGISDLNINVAFYILNLFLVGLGAYYFGDALDVLLSESFSQIFIVGILVYALPSYFIMIKKDLKSDKIK